MSDEHEHPWQARLEELLHESRIRPLAEAERAGAQRRPARFRGGPRIRRRRLGR
jgi:hypothetical protein